MIPHLSAKNFCLPGRWLAMDAMARALSTLSKPSIRMSMPMTGMASINSAEDGNASARNNSGGQKHHKPNLLPKIASFGQPLFVFEANFSQPAISRSHKSRKFELETNASMVCGICRESSAHSAAVRPPLRQRPCSRHAGSLFGLLPG